MWYGLARRVDSTRIKDRNIGNKVEKKMY